MNALLTRPGISGILIALVTILSAAYAFTALKVEGDVARALKGTSEAYLANLQLEENFGSPSKDEVLLLSADDFGAPETYAALENLVIDLQLTDGVAAVMSIFALPDPAGESISYLARSDVEPLPPAERLEGLIKSSPFAPYLLSQDHSAALVIIMPDLSMPAEAVLAEIQDTISFADPALTIRFVSLAALQREISAGLIADQLLIAPLATILCVAIALLLFRSWRPALICAFPSIVGLGLTFGAMAILGYPMDPLIAILPAILIVLGIADSIHVIHNVAEHAQSNPLKAAISQGMRETMPAVVFAGATTAVAFLSLLVAGSPTVQNLAIVGPIGLALTTLAVYLVLPPAIMLLSRGASLGSIRPLQFRAFTEFAVNLLSHHRRIIVVSFVLLAALLAMQTQTMVGYRLMDHVPRNNEFRENLKVLETVLPGSDQSFVMLQAADPEPGISPADRDLLDRAGTVLYGAQGSHVVPRDIDGVEHALVTRFQGHDGTTFALPLTSKLNVSSSEITKTADQTRAALTEVGIDNFVLTGYSLMSSVELPIVVQELRVAFYIAVGFVMLLAAMLTRSVKIALLSLIPNLIPILGVEAWLALTDRPLTITGALAFTIAFGIAVDDTIHLMNRIRIARRAGQPVDRGVIEAAVRATAAPVISTTIVLLAGFATTMLSLLPSVSVFGQLTAAAMSVALLADLLLFPSLMMWGAKGGSNT